MPFAIPKALAFNLNFVHPLLMWVVLGLTLYSMVLGIKAKKTREGSPEQRKRLIRRQFGKRHFQIASLVQALMVIGTLGGIAVTYLNNGKLFIGPHLLVGLAMTSLLVVAAALSPAMQAGNLIARKIHIGLNMSVVILFLWEALTGMQIVQILLTPPT